MLSSCLRLAVIVGTVLLLASTLADAEGITQIEELCRVPEWMSAARERAPFIAAYCQVTEDPDPIYLVPVPAPPEKVPDASVSHGSAQAVDNETHGGLRPTPGIRWSLWLIAIVR